MVKHVERKMYRLPVRDHTWYQYFLGLVYHRDAAADLVDSVETDDPMELVWRYLVYRKNYAMRHEEMWREEWREGTIDKDTVSEYIEHWTNEGVHMSQVMNFIKEVVGIDPLKEWGPFTPG